MKATHILGLMLGLGTLGVVSAAGCGSSDTSGFEDPNASSGGLDGSGPIFGGGDAGEGSTPCQNLQCQQKTCAGGGDTTVTRHRLRAERQAPALQRDRLRPEHRRPTPLTEGRHVRQVRRRHGQPGRHGDHRLERQVHAEERAGRQEHPARHPDRQVAATGHHSRTLQSARKRSSPIRSSRACRRSSPKATCLRSR